MWMRPSLPPPQPHRVQVDSLRTHHSSSNTDRATRVPPVGGIRPLAIARVNRYAWSVTTNSQARELTEDVRLAVYYQLSATGRAPTTRELAATTAMPLDAVEQALRALHDHRDLVLGARGEILMAHPFATIPLGFSVMGARTLWWGGCAWDAFAIPHLVPGEASALVATTCPACERPHAFIVERDGPPIGSQVAHFLTPTSRIWDDVVNSCANQRIFCGESCVEAWLEATANQRGDVMDLATLWRLARGWYRGRLERGYQRRVPVEAVEYFRQAGLSGPFWGLP